jgi:hypothetical protein
MTSALVRGEWSAARPCRTLPRERPSTHCTGGWVGPRAGLDRCGKSRPSGIRSPDRPVRSSVAIPTELPRPLYRQSYPAHYSRMRRSKIKTALTITENLSATKNVVNIFRACWRSWIRWGNTRNTNPDAKFAWVIMAYRTRTYCNLSM